MKKKIETEGPFLGGEVINNDKIETNTVITAISTDGRLIKFYKEVNDDSVIIYMEHPNNVVCIKTYHINNGEVIKVDVDFINGTLNTVVQSLSGKTQTEETKSLEEMS